MNLFSFSNQVLVTSKPCHAFFCISTLKTILIQVVLIDRWGFHTVPPSYWGGWRGSSAPPWARHISSPGCWDSPFPVKKTPQKRRRNFSQRTRHAQFHLLPGVSASLTRCSIIWRLFFSFRKLSFSFWACWMICVDCFFRASIFSYKRRGKKSSDKHQMILHGVCKKKNTMGVVLLRKN